MGMKKEVQMRLIPDFDGVAFAAGNAKLDDNTLIINLTAAINCPSLKLGLCKVSKVCYALRSEKKYPYYQPKNLKMEEFFKRASTEDIIDLLEAYVLSHKRKKIKYLRINESGDFKTQEQIQQWSIIADYFKNKYNILTNAFTCRADLDFTQAHFIVNASRPDVKGLTRVFKCISREDFDSITTLNTNEYKCKANCRVCNICFHDKFHGIIYCRQH